jgi:hypothetical protein
MYDSTKSDWFAVAARTAAAGGVADVAAALRFAQSHNLRLVVKASGHDMQGRSTGAGALLVWLAALVAVAVHADGFRACDSDAATPAVTAQPGATAGALQAALGDTFVIVTGYMQPRRPVLGAARRRWLLRGHRPQRDVPAAPEPTRGRHGHGASCGAQPGRRLGRPAAAAALLLVAGAARPCALRGRRLGRLLVSHAGPYGPRLVCRAARV